MKGAGSSNVREVSKEDINFMDLLKRMGTKQSLSLSDMNWQTGQIGVRDLIICNERCNDIVKSIQNIIFFHYI